jgi:hypothetical protein
VFNFSQKAQKRIIEFLFQIKNLKYLFISYNNFREKGLSKVKNIPYKGREIEIPVILTKYTFEGCLD